MRPGAQALGCRPMGRASGGFAAQRPLPRQRTRCSVSTWRTKECSLVIVGPAGQGGEVQGSGGQEQVTRRALGWPDFSQKDSQEAWTMGGTLVLGRWAVSREESWGGGEDTQARACSYACLHTHAHPGPPVCRVGGGIHWRGRAGQRGKPRPQSHC